MQIKPQNKGKKLELLKNDINQLLEEGIVLQDKTKFLEMVHKKIRQWSINWKIYILQSPKMIRKENLRGRVWCWRTVTVRNILISVESTYRL